MKHLIVIPILLALVFVFVSLALAMPLETVAQVPTLTPDIEVIFSTPIPETVVSAPTITSDLIPVVLSALTIVGSIVAGIFVIITGISASRNNATKVKADIEQIQAQTKRDNDLAAANIAVKNAEAENLQQKTKGEIDKIEAVKEQMAQEVATSLARSQEKIFEGMRLDIEKLTTKVEKQEERITELRHSNDSLVQSNRELVQSNEKLVGVNTDQRTSITGQGERIEKLLAALEKIKQYGDGAKDDATEAINKDNQAKP